ncbi:MAG: FAD-dependent oxidoreductase [Anaerolineae bacterium]|nr:FAD-dependent oxidoreductase [Anaerolineae bacterium]
MNRSLSSTDCLIIGAGLAGLHAARELSRAGIETIVLEKGGTSGGRLATTAVHTEMGTAMADEGAQYFTVREATFEEEVRGWLRAGVAYPWSMGFVTPDGSAFPDGHPRYCGSGGMASIAERLAAGLDVRLESEVVAIAHEGAWLVTPAGGERLEATALLLTAPVPQSLALLAPGDIPLPADEGAMLARIAYDPCLALTVVLNGPSQIPAPGGMWPGGERIYWMADNGQKGISPVSCLTIHATPEYSRALFAGERERIVEELLAEAAPWLGSGPKAGVAATRLRRWRYSIPLQLYPARCLLVDAPGMIAFAGDAFAGPRVEGAALSGMAAGQALIAALSTGDRR